MEPIEKLSAARIGQRPEHVIHGRNMQPFGCLSSRFDPALRRAPSGLSGHCPACAPLTRGTRITYGESSIQGYALRPGGNAAAGFFVRGGNA